MRALRAAAALIRLYESVNEDLPKRLVEDATGLREVEVQTIASRHPERPNCVTPGEYEHAQALLANFKTIYAPNYDLLLYWALMQQEVEAPILFDDGFRTTDDGPTEYVTWDVEKTDRQNIHYLHGELRVFDAGHGTQKYTWVNTGVALIDQVRAAMENNLYPLFVSDGNSNQKLAKIKHSDFLAWSYRSFAKIGSGLYVNGHSMAASDDHILHLIEKNRCAQLFVGLYGDSDSPANQSIRARTEKLAEARPERNPLEVGYFDAANAQVWRV